MSEKFKLGEFLPFRVTSLAEAMSRSLSQKYREKHDVTVPEWRVLATLAQDGSLNPGELGRRTSMEKPRVSRALSKMEGKGLIKRVTKKTDNRMADIQLSRKGQELYEKIEPVALEWEQMLLSDLTEKEIACVHAVLDKLNARVTPSSGS